MSGVTIERNGSKIELRGWVGSKTPGLCKSVPGAKWNPDAKFWSYPLDMTVCRALRAAFADDLKVGAELASWAREAIARENALAEIAGADSAELRNVPRYAPKIDAAMCARTYQQVGAAFGARVGSFLLADQPGLGKTIQTLAAIVEDAGDTPTRNLVLCPKVAVGLVWGPEVRQWLGAAAVVIELSGVRAVREALLAKALAYDGGKHLFVVGNIEMARIKGEPNPDNPKRKRFPIETAEYPALFGPTWDTLVVDESHKALIRKSGTPTQQRAGMSALKANRRVALSGTPMRGKPEQLWGTLNWLRPDLFTSYWKWVERYFNLTSNGYSNYLLNGWRERGEDDMARDLAPHMLRRTKGEVLAELPPKMYAGSYLIPGDDNSPHGVWLTMDEAQAKAYKKLEADAAITVDGGEIIADGILAENTRKKQAAGSCLKVVGGKVTPTLPSVKYDWLLAKLDEMGILDGEGDSKIVVASQFTGLLNTFAKELRAAGVVLHLLTGETSDKARKDMVDDFQNTDDVRVFLLNTKAGGVAVTLDKADDLVILDETYVPDDQEQVEDRIHRTSRMHSVTIHRLRVLDTIEEEIAYITAAREDVMKYLLDGARGVEAARAIYIAKAAA